MAAGALGMSASRGSSDLLALIYSLPTDDTAWTRICDALAATTNSAGTIIRPGNPDPDCPRSPALDDLQTAYFKGGWQKANFRNRGLALLPRKGIFVDQDFITESEMESDPFYKELLALHGIKWGAGVGFRVEGNWWLAKILRSPAQGAFGESDQHRLSDIARHLSRACEMSLLLRRNRVQGLVEALFALDLGAIAIDTGGRAVVLNRIAEGLMGKDIDVVRGHLTATDAAINDAIERMVHGLLQGNSAPENVVVPQPGGQYPLVLQACRITETGDSLLPSICGIVVISNPNRRPAGNRDLMGETFGLSRSESAIVGQLVKGHSIAEAANHMQLSRETVRSHLKSIFQKTNTHRQSELVMLASRLTSVPRHI
jgi:DNA-binding CsgD family transcriptional regulator